MADSSVPSSVGGASSAPASSPGQAPASSPGQAPSSSPTTQGTPDVHQMLQSMQGELAALRKSSSSGQAAARAAQERLERVRAAFDDSQGEPEAEEGGGDEAWFNEILDGLLDARQRGVEMPLTSRLAVELKKRQDENAALRKQLNDIAKKTDHLADPELSVDRVAYAQMDGMIGDSLGHVFGNDYPPTIGKAVTTAVVNFLGELKREAPDEWKEIRRDSQSQRKIVQHFVNEHIPARLRELNRNVTEAQRPFTHRDAREALLEAKRLPMDQRQKVMPHVREKFWETMFERKPKSWE